MSANPHHDGLAGVGRVAVPLRWSGRSITLSLMRIWIALCAACLAGCGGAVAIPAVRNASAALPVAKLAGAGIYLSSPTTHPLVTREQAVGKARGSAIAVALEHVTDSRSRPAIDQDGWVVALDPRDNHSAAGPPGSSPAPTSFWVIVVDSTTGAVIVDVSGA